MIWYAGHKPIADAVTGLIALALVIAAIRLRSRPRLAAALLALSGTAIAVAMSADDFLHAWDERYHALVGLHLTWHPLVPTLYERQPIPMPQDWGHAHIWIHKPPLPLWLIAASLKLFGTSEFAVRIPSIALHALCAYAAARIGARLFDDATGLLAGFLVAGNGQLLDLCSGRKATDHVDSLLVSFTCLAICSALSEKRPALTGALTGLAVLSKWLVGLLPFAVWWRRGNWRQIALAAAVCLAIAAPWQIYLSQMFPREAALETEHRFLHLTVPLDGHVGGWWFHLIRIPRFFGEASPLALIWFFWRRRGTPPHQLLLRWIALPYIFFSLIATKMENYVMQAAPAMALVIAAVAVEFWRLRKPLPMILAAAFVALPVRYCVERWKPLQEFRLESQAAARLRHQPSGKIVVVDPVHPIERMFYADVVAVETLTAEQRKELLHAGWTIVEAGP
jgi:4-amino-4-deoxy-L-arabinose transferase